MSVDQEGTGEVSVDKEGAGGMTGDKEGTDGVSVVVRALLECL